ncbi:hypothetical protein GCM10020254_50730 [Streptomyces goshikiensis]
MYLPLLGGPYVALIAAKAVVGMRVESGTMAKPAPKPSATGRRPLRELIANDSGRTDLVDLQYVALSAVTMLYVVLFFLSDVGAGLPDLPGEIWALTGAPAGAYLVNKMAVRPNPVITHVTVADGILTVEGGGFAPDPAGTPARVTVDDTVVPTAPDPLTGALTGPPPHGRRPRLHGGGHRPGPAQRPVHLHPGPGARVGLTGLPVAGVVPGHPGAIAAGRGHAPAAAGIRREEQQDAVRPLALPDLAHPGGR